MHGQVVDNSGNPIGALVVLVVGRGTTTTGVEGRFTVTDVTPPYDVALFDDRSGIATLYLQLSRPDPQLPILTNLFGGSTDSRSADLTGKIQGGAPLQQRGSTLGLAWGSPELLSGDFVAETPYSLRLRWYGTPTIQEPCMPCSGPATWITSLGTSLDTSATRKGPACRSRPPVR